MNEADLALGVCAAAVDQIGHGDVSADWLVSVVRAPDPGAAAPVVFDDYRNVGSTLIFISPEPADDEAEWEVAWSELDDVWPRRRIAVPVDEIGAAADTLADVLQTSYVIGAYATTALLERAPFRAWSWPLTFGVLPDDADVAFGEFVRDALGDRWPRLCRVLELGTDGDEANVLLVPGGEVPPDGRADGVRVSSVLFGQPNPSIEAIEWAHSLGAGAVGFVHELDVERIFELTRNLGHNQPLDAAFWVGPGDDWAVRGNAASYQPSHLGDVLFANRDFVDGTYIARAMERLQLRVRTATDDGLDLGAVQLSERSGRLPDFGGDPMVMLAAWSEEYAALPWDEESGDASETAEGAAETERTLAEAGERPVVRRLQVRIHAIDDEENHHHATQFVAGMTNQISLRIGPGKVNWLSLDRDFPLDKEPPAAPYTVDVEIRAPGIVDYVEREIEVPVVGASASVRIALPVPDDVDAVAVEIRVSHRGRHVQAARLDGPTGPLADCGLETMTFTESEPHPVDLGRAGPTYLRVQVTGTEIRATVPKTQTDRVGRRADIDGYITGIQDTFERAGEFGFGRQTVEQNRQLFAQLAATGSIVRQALFGDETIALTHVEISADSSTSAFPLEWLYDGNDPDADAVVCETWRAAAEPGKECECGGRTDRSVICPALFWGVSRVITRVLEDAPNPSATRRHTTLKGVGCVYGLSERIRDADRRAAIGAAVAVLGGAAPSTDWEHWKSEVTRNPQVLLALAHSTQDGASQKSLEVENQLLRISRINSSYVHANNRETGPIALLLGCTTGITDTYLEHPVRVFSSAGAKVIVATMSKVFPENAVEAATRFLEALASGAGIGTVGSLVMAVRHDLIEQNNPLALALSLHGDAEWLV